MAGTVDFFFRDDDADRDLPQLRRLLDMFGSHQAPVSLAVIPGTLTPDGARVLLERKASRARLELHQHGWLHQNHEPEGRKCEFGPARAFEQQLADMARGQARLDEMLGDAWAPVFTPPWNRCTEDTYRALEALGFTGLSRCRGGSVPAGYSFREVSACVDIFTWRSGPRLKAPEEVESEILAWMDHSQPVGVLLHHKVMDQEAFSLLEALLDALSLSPCVRFQTLSELLEPEMA